MKRGLLLGVAVATLAVRPAAQTQQRPVFRANVEMVRIDATVVDADGRAVHGLTKEDFELIDGASAQPIANFVEVTHSIPSRSWPVTLGRDVATNVVADRGRIVVLVLDDLHIRKDLTERTRQIARDFVLTLGDDAMMALLSISGRHSVELTQDRARILQAIDRFEAREPKVEIRANDGPVSHNITPRNPYTESQEDERTQYTSVSERRQLEMLRLLPLGSVDFGFSGFKMGGGTSIVPIPFDSLTTMKIFENAARMLGTDDGRRKAFVWVSSGLTYGKDGVARALDSMRRSGVVTYAVDPLGTERFAPGGAYEGLARVGKPTPWDAVAQTKRTSLTDLATQSGGFAVTNATDLEGGLARIVADLDHYYVLGFYPENLTGAGYRPVVVRVKQPGLVVRHRQGYSLDSPPTPRLKDAAVALAVGAMSKADIPMRLVATPLPPATGSKGARVAIGFELSYPRAGLEDAGGRASDTIDYAVLAVSLRSGQVVRVERDQAKMTLVPQPGGATDTVAYGVQTVLTLLPGTYQMRASAVSQKLGKGGSVYLTLDVPDLSASVKALAVSGIVLGEGRVPMATSRAMTLLAAASWLPFPPTLDREFTRAQGCRVFARVLRPKSSGAADVQIALITREDRAVKTWPVTLRESDDRIDQRLALSDIEPGAYRLRITAAQTPDRLATREVGIVVK